MEFRISHAIVSDWFEDEDSEDSEEHKSTPRLSSAWHFAEDKDSEDAGMFLVR